MHRADVFMPIVVEKTFPDPLTSGRWSKLPWVGATGVLGACFTEENNLSNSFFFFFLIELNLTLIGRKNNHQERRLHFGAREIRLIEI